MLLFGCGGRATTTVAAWMIFDWAGPPPPRHAAIHHGISTGDRECPRRAGLPPSKRVETRARSAGKGEMALRTSNVAATPPLTPKADITLSRRASILIELINDRGNRVRRIIVIGRKGTIAVLRDYLGQGRRLSRNAISSTRIIGHRRLVCSWHRGCRASAIGGRLPGIRMRATRPSLRALDRGFTSHPAKRQPLKQSRIASFHRTHRRLEARTPAAVFILIGSWQVRMDATRVFITSARFKKVPSRRERNRPRLGRALSQGARGARPPLPFEV